MAGSKAPIASCIASYCRIQCKSAASHLPLAAWFSHRLGMIRSKLVARIAAQNPHLYARDVERVVDAIFDRMTAALANGDRVELRGFGAFSTRETKARTSRNPRSGASVQVPTRAHVHFTPSKLMKARLNREKTQPEVEVERLLRAS